MVEESSVTSKGIFNAVVYANKQIGRRFYRLSLEFSAEAASAFAKARPGQFAELDLSSTALPKVENIPEDLNDAAGRKILLRRPFSFADVTVKNDKTTVEILYCVVGPASLRMTTLSAGNTVSVIGPLGNGFQIPKGKKMFLLVAGGMGAGPLIHLAKVLTADYPSIEVTAFAGAKTADELPFERRLDQISQEIGFAVPEFARYGIKSLIATDDGSAGFGGLVTNCFSQWLGQNKPAGRDTIIFGCGPEAMLAQLAKTAKEKNMDCQVSMERMMACGIGLCQSCAVECKVADSNETIYKLCCEDGPVFDGKEVVFKI
jgi:dihydroorotate dehydrogenase electron transfer subunit